MQSSLTSTIWQVLEFCGDWRSVEEIRRAVLREVPVALVERVVRSLVRATFCETSDRRRDSREVRMSGWSVWNPAAGFWHTASRHGTYVDPRALDDLLSRKSQQSPMPPVVKPAERRRMSLPGARSNAFAKVLAKRRTWRQFADTPLDASHLATLLRLTSGITHWLEIPRLGEVPLTTSPSGGCRHPLETYVVIRAVRGLGPGVYRYLPDRHELGWIRRGTSARELALLFPHQPWCGDAACVVFFTAVFARTQWRYELPRAYRAVLLEAGHVCQTFLLAATSLGLASFSTMALDDARVEKALGVDGIAEAVLYAAGAGPRPAIDPRIVMPRGRAPAKVRRNFAASTRQRKVKV